MEYDFQYTVKDGIATVTFDRPEVLNALTFAIYAQFRDLLETLRYDDAVKVLVLTGSGGAFCSGGDVHEIIGELLERDMKAHLEFTRMTGAVVANMRAARQADHRRPQRHDGGRGRGDRPRRRPPPRRRAGAYRLPLHARRADGRGHGRGYLLPRIVGQGRALELLLFGDSIDAADSGAVRPRQPRPAAR